MALRERIGVDVGDRLSAREAVEWAGENDVGYVDVRIDDRLPEGFGDAEAAAIREACAAEGVALGLHPLSGVNFGEIAPIIEGAVDRYLDAYLDAAAALGAGRIVGHGGYHFTDDRESRIEAATDRLGRGVGDAPDGVDLLLENHNPEPADAEIQYLPATVGECRRYFEAVPDVGWAFTVNHAHMRPPGIDGFLDALPVERCRQVRLADNRGAVEEHLYPGEGTVDFAGLFDRLDAEGFGGHYMLAFGDLDDMLDGREDLVELAGG